MILETCHFLTVRFCSDTKLVST